MLKNVIVITFAILFFLSATSDAARKKKRRRKRSRRPRVNYLTGDYKKGGGYKFKFKKYSFVELSGYMGASVSYYPDAEEQPEYFNFNDFRVYLKFQTSKRWKMKARFDYKPNYFLNDNTISTAAGSEVDAYGHPGIYVSRVYFTYMPSKYVNIDVGRNLATASKYGGVRNYHSSVANGVKLSLNYGISSTVLQGNFQNANTRSSSGSPRAKTAFLVAREDLAISIMKGLTLMLAGGIMTDRQHPEEKFTEYIADGNITIGSLFLTGEYRYTAYSAGTNPNTSTYASLGYGFSSWFTADAFYKWTKTLADGNEPMIDYGLNAAITIDKNKKLYPSASMLNYDGKNYYYTSLGFYYFF